MCRDIRVDGYGSDGSLVGSDRSPSGLLDGLGGSLRARRGSLDGSLRRANGSDSLLDGSMYACAHTS